MRTPKKRRPPNRKRRPPYGDFPPLDDIDFGLDSEAWTQSLVIDFWRSATFRLHTRATLQEYDLVMKKCQKEKINFGFDSEAWTQSLVIDFWRSAPVTLTPGTLQEYDLVLRKCLGENINLVLDSEAWTQSLLHENVSIEIDFHRNTFGAYCNTYNYTRILSLRRL